MTKVDLTVAMLRELFRQYQAWRSLYEAHAVPDTLSSGGIEICLWDLEYLIESTSVLPPRQRQAIRLCFIENLRERDAAVIMGVSATNPVSMYANTGLTKILAMIQSGELSRFRPEPNEGAHP